MDRPYALSGWAGCSRGSDRACARFTRTARRFDRSMASLNATGGSDGQERAQHRVESRRQGLGFSLPRRRFRALSTRVYSLGAPSFRPFFAVRSGCGRVPPDCHPDSCWRCGALCVAVAAMIAAFSGSRGRQSGHGGSAQLSKPGGAPKAGGKPRRPFLRTGAAVL